MRSLKFPKMFNKNSTNVWKSSEHVSATQQNCELLLQTERGELFGDPYYGLMFKHYLFDQNNEVLADAITDIVYTQLAIFIPQINIKRSDVRILQDKEKGKLYCEFSGTDQVDYTVRTYQLLLFQSEINEQ